MYLGSWWQKYDFQYAIIYLYIGLTSSKFDKLVKSYTDKPQTFYKRYEVGENIRLQGHDKNALNLLRLVKSLSGENFCQPIYIYI